MKLYNTLSRSLEEFVPYDKNMVRMYTCGPTVYNYAHIGNLRTYISEDILEKTLRYLGYPVTRCMNITDVGHLVSDADSGEDKMAVAAKREHKSALEIAQFYTDAFMKDIEDLNIKKPDIISKATDHIDDYIRMIKKLLQDGYAYEANGNIYFDTEKYAGYYQLSGRSKEDLMVAVRDDVEVDQFKKNPNDFGLWFTNSKFDGQELQWDSPWGRGYPGWHIECSCISIAYLGEYLDIHCGAIDAIFPHHTNEIAQSECYLGHKWCNYWVHMEFLNDATGKMSKSKGEFLTLSLLKEKGYDPIIYRYFCLQSHYRKQLVFTYNSLDTARVAYDKLYQRVQSLEPVSGEELDRNVMESFRIKFKEALSNDLNTANACTVLYDVLKANTNDTTKYALIEEFDQVLSLDLTKKKEKKVDASLVAWIEEKIDERNEAKKAKNYALADQIRDELLSKNVVIKDTREGTVYEIK